VITGSEPVPVVVVLQFTEKIDGLRCPHGERSAANDVD
jgi:hypothetical protein